MGTSRRKGGRGRGASGPEGTRFPPRVTEVSRQALNETPTRALAFLRGVSTYPAIHAELAQAGYTPEAHVEGVRLLGDALALPAVRPVLVDRSHAAAAAALAEFANTGFRRARAALLRLHPAEAETVFRGLDAAPGPPIAVALFLDRVAALERGAKAATAAAATLTARGITKAVRDALAQQIAVVKRVTPAPPKDDTFEERRRNALFALRAWLLDWSETAHAVLRSREARVRLGLARRQPRSAPADALHAARDGEPD